MFRLLVACLVAAQLLLTQGTLSGTLPDDEVNEVDEEDEDMVDTVDSPVMAVTSDLQLRSEFEKFKQTYKKKYEGDEEEENRFRFFVQNLQKARELQAADMGTAEYGVNKFSDMSDEEFDQFYLNPMMMDNSSWPQASVFEPNVESMANRSIPRCWDWRRRKAVTRVKNQRRCGACWAFSVAANIESLLYLKTRRLMSLSVQELLDCDKYDRACKGGFPFSAFNAIMKLGGMMRWKDYRYKATRRRCSFRRRRRVTKLRSFYNIRPHERAMASWVALKGPIVIMMNAMALRGYRRGILRPTPFTCPCNRLNHVTTIVGYGTYRRRPYWVMKNSWGRNWGEYGYFRMYRGEGSCGLNLYPTSAIL